MEASHFRWSSIRCAGDNSYRCALRGAQRLFGSVARGESHPGSDLDLLVEMDADRSLLDLVGLEQDLEELLDRPVDVLTDGGLHPTVRQRVLADARPL
jgi:predicted nucleotidyltransferase